MTTRDDEDERTFLHDLAGPVATLKVLLEILGEEIGVSPDKRGGNETLVLKQAREALDAITTLLASRRETLIKRGHDDGTI